MIRLRIVQHEVTGLFAAELLVKVAADAGSGNGMAGNSGWITLLWRTPTDYAD